MTLAAFEIDVKKLISKSGSLMKAFRVLDRACQLSNQDIPSDQQHEQATGSFMQGTCTRAGFRSFLINTEKRRTVSGIAFICRAKAPIQILSVHQHLHRITPRSFTSIHRARAVNSLASPLTKFCLHPSWRALSCIAWCGTSRSPKN